MKRKDVQAKPYDIMCPTCGAPAYYDIKSRIYNCMYCGGKVTIARAVSDHQGFRKIQKRKMNQALENFELQKAACTGCGAEVIFEKGDALATCAFCGRTLVRKAFVNADTIPELIIPFSITPDEAKDLLVKWCQANSRKKEAGAILKRADDIKGCYLPYELVRGPVNCSVYRIENGRSYDCEGFADKVFVNSSKNLDNRLLDGIEPFDLDEITEFDFAYVAGHQVKAADVTDKELIRRIDVEIHDDYLPVIQKTLETKAVGADVYLEGVLRMPVALPVYYLAFDGFMAAVNGQTGKVSVRAEKESHYIILPWWLKAVLWTIIATAVIALGMFLLGAENEVIVVTAGCLAVVLLIVLLTAYSVDMGNQFLVGADHKIFSSKGGPYVRRDGELVQTEEEAVKSVAKPLFFMNIEGRREVVELKFTGILRVIRTFAAALLIMFLPVVAALFVNGFDFSMINLGGSAVWFCITVPLTPVILVKFGRIELYDNPWIYIVDDQGKKKRYKEKNKWGFTKKDVLYGIRTVLFTPPGCFLTWLLIAVFCVMVYLTAFGDW